MGILSSFPCIQWCLFHFIDTTICEAILWADSLNTLRGKLNLEEKSYYTQNPMQRWGPQVNILLCQKRWFALVPSTPEKSIFLAASKFWEWMMGEDENCVNWHQIWPGKCHGWVGEEETLEYHNGVVKEFIECPPLLPVVSIHNYCPILSGTLWY